MQQLKVKLDTNNDTNSLSFNVARIVQYRSVKTSNKVHINTINKHTTISDSNISFCIYEFYFRIIDDLTCDVW